VHLTPVSLSGAVAADAKIRSEHQSDLHTKNMQ
jgi:hypothetical protein